MLMIRNEDDIEDENDGNDDYFRVYLDSLNTATEVTQACQLLFTKNVRSKMQMLVLSNKKAQDLLCEVSMAESQFAVEFEPTNVS